MQTISTLDGIKQLDEELNRVTARIRTKPDNIDLESWYQVCRHLQSARSNFHSALIILKSQNGHSPEKSVRTYVF